MRMLIMASTWEVLMGLAEEDRAIARSDQPEARSDARWRERPSVSASGGIVERWPELASLPTGVRWLEVQRDLGRSPRTVDAYARSLTDYLGWCEREGVDVAQAGRAEIAGYVRTIEVLLDRDAITNGSAGSGGPFEFYDLGHGYCSYSFFEQCPHRMACARCDFYLPKPSSRAQLLEAKTGLQRMLVEIPLTDEERAAVEGDRAAVDRLIARLADVATPAGASPREIARRAQRPDDEDQERAP
jgi:hypothetical protein